MNDKKYSGKTIGKLRLSLTAFIVFSMGFFPTIIYLKYIFIFFDFSQLWQYFLIPFLIYIGIIITIYYQIIISGALIHVFNLRYQPGKYNYNFNDKMAYRWMVFCTLNIPISKTIEIFPVGKIKKTYYRMLGMKIGDNSLVGGVIKDPCVTEFGNNVTMGEYAIVYGHIHEYEEGTITIERVKIGNNCVLGAGSIVMPGAILEDGVKLATGAVVTKGQILKKGKTYGGVPAKVIKKKIKINI
jgi:acetyltransferase-like isoleucine patch superfamily enzyme